jgi:hypothetical protein
MRFLVSLAALAAIATGCGGIHIDADVRPKIVPPFTKPDREPQPDKRPRPIRPDGDDFRSSR